MVLTGYDLIVIEDQATPLAGPVHTNLFLITICVMIAAVVVFLLVGWLTKRKAYANRLTELNGKLGKTKSSPLFIKSIKEEIAKAEAELVAGMF